MLIKNIVIFSIIILILSCSAPEVKDQYWQDFLAEIEQEIKDQGLSTPSTFHNAYPQDPGLTDDSHIKVGNQLVWRWTKDHPNVDIHKCRIKLVRYLKPNTINDIMWVIIPQIDYLDQQKLKTETTFTFYYKLNLNAQQEVSLANLGVPKEPYPKEQVSLNIIWYAMRHLHRQTKI